MQDSRLSRNPVPPERHGIPGQAEVNRCHVILPEKSLQDFGHVSDKRGGGQSQNTCT